MQKFVVGRYYFDSLFKDQADRTFVDDLMKEPYVEEKNYIYAIGNLHAEEEGSHQLLRGTFGRIRKGKFAEVYDKDKKEFAKQPVPDVADVTLDFVISHKYHLLLIEASTQIQPQYFLDKFQKIYANNAALAVLLIDFLTEEADVYETIQTWERVEKVVFKKLRPSNPSSLEDFAAIEGLLKETKSQNTTIEFHAPSTKGVDNNQEANTSGLDYESTLIKQGLALSSHGYGEAKISGEKEGRRQEVETKKFYKKIEVDFFEDGAIKKITQTIEEIAHEKDEDTERD